MAVAAQVASVSAGQVDATTKQHNAVKNTNNTNTNTNLNTNTNTDNATTKQHSIHNAQCSDNATAKEHYAMQCIGNASPYSTTQWQCCR